ncbi:MAG TPA: hypothetical protein VFX59_18715, partial [Polyangiales bacterium]|nr:hypothetical protein [Polyangiales bacterium]
FPSKPPAYTQELCTACYGQSCGAELQACEADAFCSGYLKRVRATPSGGYPAPDLLKDVAVESWESDQGRSNGGKALREFQACTKKACRAQCELGRDFSCTGRFEWPESRPKFSELRFRVVDYLSGQGANPGVSRLRFRGCPLPNQCPTPMATATTDTGGFVAATVDFSLAPPVVTVPEFNGVWLVDGRDDYPPFKLQSTRPYLDKAYAVSPFFNNDTVPFTRVSGAVIAPPSGTLLVSPFDCRDEYATGVTLEAYRPIQGGYQSCMNCGKVTYTADNNFPDPSLTEYATLGLIALLNVPADDVQDLMLVIRDTASGQPISVLTRVGVRMDEFLVITMYPASRKQLDSLPAGVRLPPMVSPP